MARSTKIASFLDDKLRPFSAQSNIRAIPFIGDGSKKFNVKHYGEFSLVGKIPILIVWNVLLRILARLQISSRVSFHGRVDC